MRRRLILVLLLLLPGLATAEPLRLVATIPPYAMLAQAVAGDAAAVTTLVQRGRDPHHFDPAITDITRLRRADLVIANGLGLRRVEKAIPDDAPTLRVAEAVTFEPIRDGSGAVNPHIWLDPAVARRGASALAERLSQLRPDQAEAFRRRAGAFDERLAAATRQARSLLTDLPTRLVVTQHPGFDYFLRRFDLELAGTYTDLAGSEPGPHRVRELIEAIRAAAIPAVFGEPQLPDGPVASLAAEAGVGRAELDPLGLAKGIATYPNLILINARRIRDAYNR